MDGFQHQHDSFESHMLQKLKYGFNGNVGCAKGPGSSVLEFGNTQLLQARQALRQKIKSIEEEQPRANLHAAEASERVLQSALAAAQGRLGEARAHLAKAKAALQIEDLDAAGSKDNSGKLKALLKSTFWRDSLAAAQADVEAGQADVAAADQQVYNLLQQHREAAQLVALWRLKVSDLEYQCDRLHALDQQILEPAAGDTASMQAAQQLQEDIESTNERLAALKQQQAQCVKGVMLQKLLDKDAATAMHALQAQAWGEFIGAANDARAHVGSTVLSIEHLLPDDLLDQLDLACARVGDAVDAVSARGWATTAQSRLTVGSTAIKVVQDAVAAMVGHLQQRLQAELHPGVAFLMRQRDDMQLRLYSLYAYLVESKLMSRSSESLRREFLVDVDLSDQLLQHPHNTESSSSASMPERPYNPAFSIRRGAKDVRQRNLGGSSTSLNGRLSSTASASALWQELLRDSRNSTPGRLQSCADALAAISINKPLQRTSISCTGDECKASKDAVGSTEVAAAAAATAGHDITSPKGTIGKLHKHRVAFNGDMCFMPKQR